MEWSSVLGFDNFSNRIRLTGSLRLASGLHIGTGRDLGIATSDMPVLKDIRQRPFIPGSSFKGVLRSNLESWLRAFDSLLACDPTDNKSKCISSDFKKDIMKYFKDESDYHLIGQACRICRLFGSSWTASKLSVIDMPVGDKWRNEWFMVRDGVVIDRESETAVHGFKYDFEAVPEGTEFQLEMLVENPEPYEMGLIAVGIDLINKGLALIGGNTSRGLGRAIINIEDISELSALDILAELKPENAEAEIDKGILEEKTQDIQKPDDIKPSNEEFSKLIECFKEKGENSVLSFYDIVSCINPKGITNKTLRSIFNDGKYNMTRFVDDAVKQELIDKTQDEKYCLHGAIIEESPKEEPEKPDDNKSQIVAQKMKAWKNELWKSLQPDVIKQEKEKYEKFMAELDKRKKEEGKNV